MFAREIEAWYLAGLDEAAHARSLDLLGSRNIDSRSPKSISIGWLVAEARTYEPAMVEILRHYDVEVARQRSPSFGYFWQKHVE